MNCPSCNRLLYNRMHKTCGFCGAGLPPEVLFSEAEIAAIKKNQEAMAIWRAETRAKDEMEKEKQKRAANDATMLIFPFFF